MPLLTELRHFTILGATEIPPLAGLRIGVGGSAANAPKVKAALHAAVQGLAEGGWPSHLAKLVECGAKHWFGFFNCYVSNLLRLSCPSAVPFPIVPLHPRV